MKFNKLIVNNGGNGLEKYIRYESVFLKILNNYRLDIKPNYTDINSSITEELTSSDITNGGNRLLFINSYLIITIIRP